MMRKLLFGAILALLFCYQAFAVTPASTEFEGFGLLKVFSTDHPVILRADGEPYYNNVHRFIATGLHLAARLRNSNNNYAIHNYDMPYGTLTDMASGMRYRLAPANWFGNFYRYTLSDIGYAYELTQ